MMKPGSAGCEPDEEGRQDGGDCFIAQLRGNKCGSYVDYLVRCIGTVPCTRQATQRSLSSWLRSKRGSAGPSLIIIIIIGLGPLTSAVSL